MYWPHMAVDVMATVGNCHSIAPNRVGLRKHLNCLKLSLTLRAVQSFANDIYGPLFPTKHGKCFILAITDRFTKLTQATALRTITARKFATAFCETWACSYDPPQTLLSENGTQIASRLFQNVCQLMGLHNHFTSAYHPQTTGQAKQYSWTLPGMLLDYVTKQ